MGEDKITEMTVRSKMIKWAIEKLLSKIIKDKLGCKCDVSICDLGLLSNSQKTSLTITAGFDIDTNDIPVIMRKFKVINDKTEA